MTEVDTYAEMAARHNRLARRVTRNWRIAGVAVATQLVLTVSVLLVVLGVTSDTNEDQEQVVVTLQDQIGALHDQAAALQQTNSVLADRNVELADELAESEDLQGQAVDHVERLALQVIELGGDPGIIRIEPKEDPDG